MALKKISFKKAIETVFQGATNIKLKTGKVNGSNDCISGFFTCNDTEVYYIHRDLRSNFSFNFDASGVMYRSARDYRDYSGGTNTWDFSTKLHNLGYRI